MAFDLWITHEEAKAEEVKRVMDREVNEPLWIIEELRGPCLVTSNNRLIPRDPRLAPSYIEKHEYAILHFKDNFRLLGSEILQYF